jgi:hypothetical protein
MKKKAEKNEKMCLYLSNVLLFSLDNSFILKNRTHINNNISCLGLKANYSLSFETFNIRLIFLQIEEEEKSFK